MTEGITQHTVADSEFIAGELQDGVPIIDSTRLPVVTKVC